MSLTVERLQQRIAMGRGAEPADLVLRNAQVLNTATGVVEATDIAIGDGIVVGIHEDYRGREERQLDGRFVVPGFIDTHVHVESSLVTPAEFERLVVPRGTTTAICDPHEIANVLGVAGIRYMLDAAATLSMDLRVQLSSCVPASPLETSGATLEVADLLPLLAHPKALGLAEMMNFPGVLAGDAGLMAKLAAFAERPIDGHAPLLRGSDLNGYLAAGVRTEHEATSLEEAGEKLRKGMAILLREGSIAKNVDVLAPLLTPLSWTRCAFCTDDRNPLEVLDEGHIDHAIRLAIAAGADPISCYRAASLSAAQLFGLRDRGMIAPGYRADLVVLDDLARVSVHQTILAGREFVPSDPEITETGTVGRGSMHRQPLAPDDFAISAQKHQQPVIGARRFSLLTDRLERELPVVDGKRVADPTAGIVKLAVCERHGRGETIGRAFVEGFGAVAGALATTVGHDSHNLTVLGSDDGAMAAAANHLLATGGGLCAAAPHGEILADLPLPIAGLMSDRAYGDVATALRRLRTVARDLGCTLDEPFLHMAFLPLTVIPHLKLSDRGLVDVDRFAFVD